MKITVMKYGEALYAEQRIFSTHNTENMIPMSFCFYLIQTEGKNILVDVGCEGKEHYNMYAYIAPVDLLKECSLTPNDITDIIVTHAHFDHVDDIARYKNADIHVQRFEYENRHEYFENSEKIKLFDEEFSPCDGVTVKRYGGHTEGSCIVFAKNFVICGDECYFKRNLEEKIPTGNSRFPEKSKAFVEEYHSSPLIPLLLHDSAILSGRAGYECVYED